MSTVQTTYERKSWQEYCAIPGLSNSAMKDLAVSPLRFWHKHLNPNRPADEPTPEMQFGSALHCAVLEPSEFDKRYARQVSADDFEGCLVTIDDMRQWLKDKGATPKGTRKADVIAQVQGIDRNAPILEVIERQHDAEHAGKVTFKPEDWTRLAGAAKALTDEPRMQELLRDGQPEVAMTAVDPETGVILKARMDWAREDLTADLKTFTQKRGKSIDQSVADAIYYEGYYKQGYNYAVVRGWPKWQGDFVLAFVESDPPHEVRLRSLRPKIGGEVNLYWEKARIETRELIRLYDRCMRHFGPDKPWRYAQEVTPLADEEMPQMAY